MSGFSLGDASSQPAPVSSDDEAVRFISRVLPPGEPGRRIGLHWFPNDKEAWDWASSHGHKRPAMRGRAFLTAEEAVSYARWMLRQAQAKNEPAPDLYVCMALCGMEVASVSKGGYTTFKPTRQAAAHRASKTLFADLDVQAKGKKSGYPDKPTLLNHVDSLVASGVIPQPTLMVDSGNGIHIHWVLDRELNANEWEVLARALENHLIANNVLMDRGVATDSVRVLRLPGTFNLKDMANPIPTCLVGNIDPNDIPVATMEALLNVSTANAAPLRQPTQATQAQSITAATLPAAFQGHTPFVEVPAEPEFSAGVDPNLHVAQRIDFGKVVENCPALKGIQARNGAGDPGVLWNLALLAASFADEADRVWWAHEFSKGYATYKPEETEAKLQEKIDARTRSGGRIGWPSCAAFSRNCGDCATCPHFKNGQSPMHQGIVVPAAAAAALDLPYGYTLDPTRGVMTKPADSESDELVVVVPHQISDVCIEERADGVFLSAQIEHAHNPPTRLRLPISAATSWRDEATKALGAAHIVLLPEQIPLARRFFVSFIHKLQAQQSNVVVRDPYGWVKTRSGAPGFAYGGRIYHANGEEPAAAGDEHFAVKFRPHGTLDAWIEAAAVVMDMGRIEIQAAIATAFAGPLMRFTGENGVVVSVYSPFSGVQKSSAIKIAQSVWGDPRGGLTRIDDTSNAVGKKLGMLRHIPVYWDELQRREQTQGFASLAFALTMGTEKARMGADTKMRQSGEWATMLVCGSNNSVREIMEAEQATGSAAGIARVLEFEVQRRALTSSAAESAITLSKAHDNFGLVGVEYAKLLASLHDKLPASLAAVSRSFEQKVGSDPEQRFWIAAASTIYLGAALANKMANGSIIQFPLPALHDFLAGVIIAQQTARKRDVVDMGSLDNAVRIVQGFINHCREENTALETASVPKGAGRPTPVELRFVSQDAQRLLRAPRCHIIHDDGKVRVLIEDFRRWVQKDLRLPFDAVRRDLEQFGNMTEQRTRWAAGTQWAGPITRYWEIDTHFGRTPLGARIGHGK